MFRPGHFARSFLFCLTLVSPSINAQSYTVRSPYLLDPDLAIGYVDSCARLWIHAADTIQGGFFTNVNRQGYALTAWGTNKDVLSQSRDAYGFTRAFMLTGNETYLTMARHALTFQYAHGWDTLDGGWLNNLDISGTPTNPNGTKTAFYQHYALLGPAASFEATRDTTDWFWLMRGYASNEAHLWDTRPDDIGYYDMSNRDWTARTNKSFNATVDAVTTTLVPLYLLTGDSTYATRLRELASDMRDVILPTMYSHAIGFVEMYDSNWGWTDATGGDQYHNRTIMGHVLKTAWCFGRINQLLPDPTYIPAAESLITNVWQKGYDHVYGGPYKDYDRTNGTMFMYGQDTAKAWWQMEQAVVAGLMLHRLTGRSEYLQMADETLQFYMKHFVDHTYGDVYSDVAHDGAGWLWNDAKGNSGKAAYHSIETGYYVYLYGKLLLRGEPATLHYMIAPSTAARDIPLNPIELPSSAYRITSVQLNGASFADYDGTGRTLHLNAGAGGHFIVTFAPTVTSVVTHNDRPTEFGLAQNYPNPFNPSTTIQYALPRRSHVTLAVFNTLGQKVAELVNEEKSAGSYEVRFDAGELASGMYLCRLQAGSLVQTRKLLLVR